VRGSNPDQLHHDTRPCPDWLALPGATLLPVPPQVTSRWLEMLRLHPVRGGAVFDLQLIATSAANGVDRICTFNRADFGGFAGLEIVTP